MAETSLVNSKHTIFSNQIKTTLALNALSATHVKYNLRKLHILSCISNILLR
jgi:hypothetical protein